MIIVAGDTPADALAAAPLSDPTNRSDQPRMIRVAAADPFFDPVGEVDRVDTFAAPIIVTTSARAGARSLASPAWAAAAELRGGGCTTAREAIIVGGNAAVPVEVEGQLVQLGYEEVFRVAGADRYDTAARIAAALGTEPAPAGADCADERTDDGDAAMGFYGNAVIEYRPDAASCQLQGRAVALADGRVGADALAAGWWTSYWQVPVLLVDGEGNLPAATRAALQSLAIDTIVVLGGTARIPEGVVEEAGRLATAVVGRFAGSDRYETSVVGARAFGGWHATGDAEDFSGDRVCVAASSGTSAGWPDALAAGPFCGRLAANTERRAPDRVLEPVETDSIPLAPPPAAHDAAPVLLVPTGEAPTSSVTSLLGAVFPGGDEWCRSGTTLGCSAPGFAVGFGGAAVLTDGALASVSAALSGGDAAQRGAEPTLEDPFRTALDLSPVFVHGNASGAARACADRDAISGARWLAVYADPALRTFHGSLDLTDTSTYADLESRPTCVGLGDDPASTVLGVSAAGRRSAAHVLGSPPAKQLSLSGPMVHPEAVSAEGSAGTTSEPGEGSAWHFRDRPRPPLRVEDGDRSFDVRTAVADVSLSHGAVRTTFTAALRLEGGDIELVGEATGEAIFDGVRWELAGRFRLLEGEGGFRATLDTAHTAANEDDRLTWRIDASRP